MLQLAMQSLNYLLKINENFIKNQPTSIIDALGPTKRPIQFSDIKQRVHYFRNIFPYRDMEERMALFWNRKQSDQYYYKK